MHRSSTSELGREFLEELDASMQRILDNPGAWQVLEGEIRRCRLRRFPYGIIYTLLEDNSVFVISVMHLHQRPTTWRKNAKRL